MPGTGRAPAGRLEGIMAEPDSNGIIARLWKLPGQLLLALINATAILVIVAAVLALVAIARIDHFAGNVAATMTEAVLSKMDLPPKDVLADLRNLAAEVRTLRDAIVEIKAEENSRLQSDVAELKGALTALNSGIGRLGSARSIITDEAISQVARAVSDTLVKLRGCASDLGRRSVPSS
jgi:hypothetical protein